MRVIDAHQHIWDLESVEYPWLVPEYGVLYQSYSQDEADALLRACGVDGSVLVQSANSVEDTKWMQRAADASPMVKAIVGWVPLYDVAGAERILDEYASDPRIVGIRHLIHTEPDADWLLRSDVGEGLHLLEERGYSFDVVAVLPRHLELVPIISERHPRLRMVIDHLAKPPILQREREPWSQMLREAAQNPNVYAKVSGLNTAADPEGWTAADLRPYVEHALAVFGAQRLMYGGDWPVTNLAGGYERVWSATQELLAQLDESSRSAILGGSASDFYRIPS